MATSFFFLTLTREKEQPPAISSVTGPSVWSETKRLLIADSVFRRFLVIQMIFHLGMIAFSFYAIYAVGERGVSVALVGVLTAVMMVCQMVANPLLGVLGDRTSHYFVLFLGTLAAMLSAALAGFLTSVPALFVIFGLAGIAYTVGWTTTMVLSLRFGKISEQSTYIGMTNTLIAPVTLAAPFLAGLVINAFGYQAMFQASAMVFLVATVVSLSMLRLRLTSRL